MKTMSKTLSKTTKAVAAGTLLLAGFGGGAAVMTAGSASATDSETPSASGPADPSQPQRSDEQLLTGDTLTKVTAAVRAAYPDATIERVESDSDGVYEGHVVTADGVDLIVQVGSDFSVTGTQSGHGDHDGDGPGDDASTDAPAG